MLKHPYHVYGPDDVWVPAKLNFGDFMIRKLLEYQNKIAIINAATDERVTFNELAQRAMNAAVSLTRVGIGKGDSVLIASESRQEYFVAILGITCTGATLSCINYRYTEEEFINALNISKPSYIFMSLDVYKKQEANLKSIPYLKKIILFGDERESGTFLYNDLTITEESNVKIEEFKAVDVQGQTDTLFILYSSGTTGMPKGVMLTHLNVLTLCCAPCHKKEEFSLIVTPWYHIMGLMSILRQLSLGWTTTYLPKFNMKLFLDTIDRYKIDQTIVVPSLLIELGKTIPEQTLSSMKLIYCGAAPLKKDALPDVHKRFPNLDAVLQGYGMTECTYAVIMDNDVKTAKPGGVGPVFNSLVVKVVDPETGKPLGPNCHGEICVKGPMVMKGYVDHDTSECIDDEGFYKTGDIGYYDLDEYFFAMNRIKEIIKYKGYQVAPVEIESVLLKHEAVRDAGVVGIDHEIAGEVPLAFVVVQPGKTVSEEELKAVVAEKLSNPKHLRGGVRFVTEIPRNASGKILRKELRKMAEEEL